MMRLSSHNFVVFLSSNNSDRPHTKLEADSSFRSKVIKGPEFRPTADPLPGGAGRPKFNQLETVTTFTYRPSLVKIDARNFELSW